MNDMSKETEKISDNAGHRDRVRNAMTNNPDLSSFADYELLEYLLFVTIPRQDTKPLAKKLIRMFGSLSAVLGADYQELKRIPGVGDKTAHLLANISRIVSRAEYSKYAHPIKLSTHTEMAQYMYARFLGRTKEFLFMTSININDEVIQTDEIAEGSVDSAPFDMNKIFRFADRNGAKKIVLSHNHPGGTLSFSDADIKSTARVIECCNLMGYTFVDHLIFVGNRYLSMFADDMLVGAIEQCRKEFSDLSKYFAKEKSRREILMKMGESEGENEENLRKLHILETYLKLRSLNNIDQNSIMRGIVHTIK